MRPFELIDFVVQCGFLRTVEEIQPLQLLRDRPAFIPVESEHERGGFANGVSPLRHFDEEVVEKIGGDPVVRERDFPLVPLDQFQLVAVHSVEPTDELDGVAHRRGEQQQPNVLGQ